MNETILREPGELRRDSTALIAPETTKPLGLAPVLLQYWWMLLRWKWVILSIVTASLVFGLVWTLSIAPRYTATTQIEINREQKNVTNVEGLDRPDRGVNLEFYQTQYALLTTRSLAERVARSLKLGDSPEFFAAAGAPFDLPSDAKDRDGRFKRAVILLQSALGISPVRGSALININYTSRSPAISSAIANQWAKQFVEQTLERRFASTSDARNFLQRRLDAMRERVEASERRLTNYAIDKGIVRLSDPDNTEGKNRAPRTLVSENLEALNGALAGATNERIAAENAVAAARRQGSSMTSLGSQAIALLQQRRAEISAELAKSLAQFEPEYPANRSLRSQLAALDAGIAREEARTNAGLRANYDQALGREQALRTRVEDFKARLDQQQQDSIQYNILQRDADSNRTLYEGLLQRYKEIGVAGIAANDILIVDNALPPRLPSSPNLILNLIFALGGGLALAILVTSVLDQIDDGVRNAQQVSKEFDLPTLGYVPFMAGGELAGAVSDPKSIISEAYLSIRSSLALTTSQGLPRSLIVTSTRAGEGKSNTALGLAVMLSKASAKVLLVDADMRRPSQHVLFEVANQSGLSNLLAGEDDWARYVRSSALGPDFLSSGIRPPSAAELLSTDRLPHLIAQLLTVYDHVVLDAPPMLGLADAPLIGQVADGAVFVVEAERTPVRAVGTAVERLQKNRVHIFGVVLSKVRRGAAGTGYDYEYDYAYGRDRDHADSATNDDEADQAYASNSGHRSGLARLAGLLRGRGGSV